MSDRLLAEASELAANAALASKAQGKHQAFHEALLAMKEEMTKEHCFPLATDGGLDSKRLDADMANPVWQYVSRIRALANALGITGTPGFIVGPVIGTGARDLKALKELLAGAWPHV